MIIRPLSKQLAPSLKATGLSDVRFLEEAFLPGRWLERQTVKVPSCIAIRGSYMRDTAIEGGFHSDKVHFFALTLAGRAPGTTGRLVECSREPQPLGDVLFVPAGYHYAGRGGAAVQHQLYLFLNAAHMMEDDPLDIGARPSRRMQDFMNLRNQRIQHILRQINLEMHNPSFGSELMIEGLSTTLLVETARLMKQVSDIHFAKGGLAPAALRKVRDRVLEEDQPPTLEELAQLCNLSRRHLMRAFRESTGQTIGQFLQQALAEKATFLLLETEMPIHQIATRLGFASTSAFSTAFRRLTGESPRSFRAKQSRLISFHESHR